MKKSANRFIVLFLSVLVVLTVINSPAKAQEISQSSVRISASETQPPTVAVTKGAIVPFTSIVVSPEKPVLFNEIEVQTLGSISNKVFKRIILIS